jgi:phenylalanyl-tRNA synthetase beta subunit
LIVSELEKNLDNIELTNFSDIYEEKQKTIKIDFDLNFINNLIGKEYSREQALNILNNL